VLHEASEVYNYFSCMQAETDPRVRAVWERMLGYELGHLQEAKRIFEQVEKRDIAEILPATLPEPIQYVSHRAFVREVLRAEVDLRARGTRFVTQDEEGEETLAYRKRMNRSGSPSQAVANGYRWMPGTELSEEGTEEGGAGGSAERDTATAAMEADES
jgi:hypothetical protein